MIARIAPLRNMPRSMGGFDYRIPPHLEDLTHGVLTSIPFKKSETLGLVLSIHHDSSIKKAKSIIGRLNTTPLYTKEHLALYQELADVYGVSISHMLKIACPPLQKRKIRSQQLSVPELIASDALKERYEIYSSNAARRDLLKSLQTDSTLTLVPEQRFLYRENDAASLWYSGLTTAQKFSTWMSVRTTPEAIIEGTRSALFLPFQRLNTIIIDMAHMHNHKHWDQAPRYHAHDVARIIAKKFGSQIIFADYSPSVEHYISLPTEKKHLLPNPTAALRVVSRGGHQKSTSLVAPPVIEAIRDCKTQCLLLLNRKGYATTVTCKECGHTEKSPHTGLPLVYFNADHSLRCPYTAFKKRLSNSCELCGAHLLLMRGAGIERVVEFLASEFPERAIIHIDADSQPSDGKLDKSSIIVGTHSALQYVHWQNLGMSVILDTDRRLSIPEYGAREEFWHTLTELCYHAPEALIYLQTRDPDHEFFSLLTDPQSLYESELITRKQFNYPPYGYLIRYMFAHPNQHVARDVAHKQYMQLKKALTKIKKHVTILHPLPMHPIYFRGKHWQLILCKITAQDPYDMVRKLNMLFPPQWKIDPNPIRILHP